MPPAQGERRRGGETLKRKSKRPQPISHYVVNPDAVALAMLRDAGVRRLLLSAGARSHGGPGLRPRT